MGAYAGPDISENGLVLALDAGNLKSYDYTENLTPYSAARISPNNWTESTSNTTYTQLDLNALGKFPGVLVTSTTGAAWHRRGTGYTQSFVSGTTYTLTYFYREGSTGNARLQVRINSVESLLQGPVNGSNWTVQETAGTISNISTTLLEDGLTYKTSYTLVSNQTGTVSIAIGIGSAVAGGTVIALGVQLEQRDFATDYTETTGTAKLKSTSILDISNNSNTGTLTNGVDYVGTNGGSLSFDGSDDYVNIGNVGSPQQFTFSCWVNATELNKDANNNYRRILVSSVSNNIVLIEQDGRISFRVPGHTNQNNYTAGSVSLNTWTQITCVYDQDYRRIYQNGNLVGQQQIGSATVNFGNIQITDVSGQIFKGFISNIQIHNRALTSQEIQQNFNATRSRFGI